MGTDMNRITKLASTLPFDQYSRQLIVSRLIDATIRHTSKKQKLKVIDLGGHKGKTSEFQPRDEVTILDVFDVSYKNYIKGDATKTDFTDNYFDAAVSFDVFEHIPRSQRKAFVAESLRISSFGVFVAMPVDTDNKVASAEVLLNDFYKTAYSEDHPWLKEHIEYKIPTENEIQELVKNEGAEMVSISTNQVGDWQLMQMLIFASGSNEDITKDIQAINTWYNQNINTLDANVDIGYRKVFFISKNKENVALVKNAIEKFSKKITDNDYVTVHRETFTEFSSVLSKISKKYSQLYRLYSQPGGEKDELNREIERLHKKLSKASDHITKLTADLNNIYDSSSWKASKPLRGLEKVNKKLKKTKART